MLACFLFATMDVSAIFLAFLKLLEIYLEPKIREPLYFVLRYFFILPKTNKRYGVEASIRCDLLMQQHMHGTCQAYWRCYGISLLSESAAIPPEVQHQFLEKYKGSLILGFCVYKYYRSQHMSSFLYLSHCQAKKAQASLCICADLPEPSMLAYTMFGCR